MSLPLSYQGLKAAGLERVSTKIFENIFMKIDFPIECYSDLIVQIQVLSVSTWLKPDLPENMLIDNIILVYVHVSSPR